MAFRYWKRFDDKDRCFALNDAGMFDGSFSRCTFASSVSLVHGYEFINVCRHCATAPRFEPLPATAAYNPRLNVWYPHGTGRVPGASPSTIRAIGDDGWVTSADGKYRYKYDLYSAPITPGCYLPREAVIPASEPNDAPLRTVSDFPAPLTAEQIRKATPQFVDPAATASGKEALAAKIPRTPPTCDHCASPATTYTQGHGLLCAACVKARFARLPVVRRVLWKRIVAVLTAAGAVAAVVAWRTWL